jgi:hypothetical protein
MDDGLLTRIANGIEGLKGDNTALTEALAANHERLLDQIIIANNTTLRQTIEIQNAGLKDEIVRSNAAFKEEIQALRAATTPTRTSYVPPDPLGPPTPSQSWYQRQGPMPRVGVWMDRGTGKKGVYKGDKYVEARIPYWRM